MVSMKSFIALMAVITPLTQAVSIKIDVDNDGVANYHLSRTFSTAEEIFKCVF